MFNLKENWQAMALVAVVSVICVLAVERFVLAAWQDPTDQPGSAAVGGIMLNPLSEDLDLGGYNIVDTEMDVTLSKTGTVQANAYCCRANIAAFSGLSDNSAGYAFFGKNTQAGGTAGFFQGRIAAYLEGNVGIGRASAPTHLLELVSTSTTQGGINAEINIKSGASNYWAIYQNEVDGKLKFWNTTVPNGNSLVLDTSGNVEITNGYLQIDSRVGSPAPLDCNASNYGRMILDLTTVPGNKLYICGANALGPAWRYASLN